MFTFNHFIFKTTELEHNSNNNNNNNNNMIFNLLFKFDLD